MQIAHSYAPGSWQRFVCWLLLCASAPTLPCFAQRAAHHLTSTIRHPAGYVGHARRGRNRGEGYFQPVQIKAPMGTMISVASAGDFDTQFPAPAQFGLEVTETYRFRISDIPLLDGITLYPTIEILDRLHPPPGRKQEFPVPVELTIRELRMAAAGALITRVIYLDDPRNPSFESPRDGQQPYFEVFPKEDPLVVADDLGRPIAILRVGAKSPPASGPSADFLFHSPPIENAGELSPWIQSPEYCTVATPDAPVLCPADLYGERGYPVDEYLCDGGDGFYRSTVNSRGELLGLEPSETVARFTTVQGEVHTTSGNRACIYGPRFAATRKTMQANQEANIDFIGSVQDPTHIEDATHNLRASPATHHLELLQSERTQLSRTLEDQNRGLLVENQNAASANVQRVLPHASLTEVSASILETADLASTLDGTANAIAWTSAQAVQVVLEGKVAATETRARQPQAVEIYEMPPGRPRLRIIKMASTDAAQPGELVTFTIRFTNIGETPLSEVAILDNLLPRLVYEEGSQTCTQAAAFAQEPGTAGSAILTWTLIAPLDGGAGGEIQFRCRAD